jgi:bifunctional non-homologous end joining protein LigD
MSLNGMERPKGCSQKCLDWTEKFPAIANAARRFPDCTIDGEIVALDHNGAPDFAALQAALSERNTDQLVFFAFDLLFVGDMDLGHEDLRELPLAERKARLKAVLASQKKTDLIIRYVEHFETAGDAVLRSACRMALEGIVSKRLDALHVRAWRCLDEGQMPAGHEVVIGGWSETSGRFRSLLVGARRGDHLIYLGRVGTGFGQATVARIFPKLKALEPPRAHLGVPTHRGRNAACIG